METIINLYPSLMELIISLATCLWYTLRLKPSLSTTTLLKALRDSSMLILEAIPPYDIILARDPGINVSFVPLFNYRK